MYMLTEWRPTPYALSINAGHWYTSTVRSGNNFGSTTSFTKPLDNIQVALEMQSFTHCTENLSKRIHTLEQALCRGVQPSASRACTSALPSGVDRR